PKPTPHLGWQNDPGHEQMAGPWLPTGNLQGLATITGLQHRVAVDPERLEHDVANLVFVLHHQDRLGAPQRLRRPARLEGWNRVVDASQVDREGAAAARLAVHPDRAPALIHDAVDRREPQTDPPPVLFGREERLEDARLGRGAHAEARL